MPESGQLESKVARGRVSLTACQVRMARAALRWSVEELARHADVSERTIRRIEKVFGFPPNVTIDTLDKLQMCFEAEGMTLIPKLATSPVRASGSGATLAASSSASRPRRRLSPPNEAARRP